MVQAQQKTVCVCKKEGLEQVASRGNAVSSSGACGYFVTFQSFTHGRSQGKDTRHVRNVLIGSPWWPMESRLHR